MEKAFLGGSSGLSVGMKLATGNHVCPMNSTDCNNSQCGSGDSHVYAFDITARHSELPGVSVEMGTDIQNLHRTRKMMISAII